MSEQPEMKTTTIRVPHDLSEWLEEQASRQHRSVNGQIISILTEKKRAQEIDSPK